MKFYRLRSICIALLVMIGSSAHGAKLAEWVEYRSQHFILYSDRAPREAQTVLQGFERFRAAVLLITGLADTEEDERTHIYLFNDTDTYQLIQPDSSIAGFYRDTLQGARMVVGAEANLDDISLVLFHEYAHHIIRSRSNIQYPLWYDEGFADVLASAQIRKRHVVVGLSNPWREKLIGQHQMLPLAELLRPVTGKNEAYWDRYYSSAWMFVHFLQMGFIYDDQQRADQLRRYIIALHQGADPIKALESQFGLSVEALEKQVKRYAEQRYWKGFKVDVPAYRGPLVTRPLPKNESVYLLADLAYRSGQQDSALAMLQYVDASSPSVAPALSLRAVLEGHKQRIPVAQHFMALALNMDANDPSVATNAAHFYWDSLALHGVGLSAEEQLGLQQKVEQFASFSLSADDQNLEAGRFLALCYQRSGDLASAINVMQGIYQHRPTDVQLNFELGKLLVKSLTPQSARPYLKNVIAWDHSIDRKRVALKLLEKGKADDGVMVLSKLADDS